MPFCDTCGDWAFEIQYHQCPPTWDAAVILPGYDDDDLEWRQFYARDAEGAARKAAEEYDQEDYPLVRGQTVEVRVRMAIVGSETVHFQCSAEAIPHYYAKEIRPCGG